MKIPTVLSTNATTWAWHLNTLKNMVNERFENIYTSKDFTAEDNLKVKDYVM